MAKTPTKFVRNIQVIDPDTKLPVELEIRKCMDSGALIGIDGSYLEVLGPVRNPYNSGNLIIPDDEQSESQPATLEEHIIRFALSYLSSNLDEEVIDILKASIEAKHSFNECDSQNKTFLQQIKEEAGL